MCRGMCPVVTYIIWGGALLLHLLTSIMTVLLHVFNACTHGQNAVHGSMSSSNMICLALLPPLHHVIRILSSIVVLQQVS